MRLRSVTLGLITLLILGGSLVWFIPSSQAGFRDAPPAQPGWTRDFRYPDDTAEQHGLLLAGGPIVRGSPVIAEIDGNTENGLEVAVAGADGTVYVYRANGSLLWSRPVPIVGCHPSFSLVNSKPSVGAIYGDGVPYVLVGYGTIEDTRRACDGGVIAYLGSNGDVSWNFSLQAFEAQTPEPPEDLHAVITTPALADVDGNGRLEIAFGGFDRNVYLLNADSSVRWFYHAADTVWSTPMFLNIDDDSELELIVATDISANPQVIPPTIDGGFVHAFDTAPRTPTRIEFQTGFIWRTPNYSQVYYSSPAAGDVLASNPGVEIVIGTGCFFPAGSSTKNGRFVQIFRPADGVLLQTLNASECVQSSPALGDLDGDGLLEIVVNVGSSLDNGLQRSEVVAWDAENPNPKWRFSPSDANEAVNDPDGGDLQSPVIADLDGNGSLEVLAANFWSVHVLAGATGNPLTCQNSATCGNQLALFAWFTLKSTPAVADLDGDGDLEVVIGGSHVFNSSRGHLYAWTDFQGLLASTPGTAEPYSAPWPQFRRTATADGVLVRRALQLARTQIAALTDGSEVLTIPIAVTTTDGSVVDLSRTQQGDNDVLVTSTISSQTAVELTVFIDASTVPVGTYTSTITVSSPGLPDVAVTVQVTVVDQLSRVYLPLVRRR
ncbi:MAG: FG-GAP repeat domain-containing protein [Oscillochloridaceae bacterium umkhey_bin13]